MRMRDDEALKQVAAGGERDCVRDGFLEGIGTVFDGGHELVDGSRAGGIAEGGKGFYGSDGHGFRRVLGEQLEVVLADVEFALGGVDNAEFGVCGV